MTYIGDIKIIDIASPKGNDSIPKNQKIFVNIPTTPLT